MSKLCAWGSSERLIRKRITHQYAHNRKKSCYQRLKTYPLILTKDHIYELIVRLDQVKLRPSPSRSFIVKQALLSLDTVSEVYGISYFFDAKRGKKDGTGRNFSADLVPKSNKKFIIRFI